MWRKFALSLISSLATAAAVSFAIDTTPFKERFYALNTVSYFYIGYDWSLKLSRVLLGLPDGSSAFFGTSRTIYAVDPRVHPRVLNLGLLAASQREVNRLLEAARGGRKASEVFLEANVVSLSGALIESNSRAEFAHALDHSRIERMFPLLPWLNLHVPLFAQRPPLSHTVSRLLQARPGELSPEEAAKRRMHLQEFLWLDAHKQQGFVPGRPPPDPATRAYLRESCSTMISWVLREGTDLSDGYELFAESLRLAREAGSGRVVAWVPPATAEMRGLLSPHVAKMRGIAKAAGAEFVDLSDLFTANEEASFLDCIHVQERGAAEVTRLLLGRAEAK